MEGLLKHISCNLCR